MLMWQLSVLIYLTITCNEINSARILMLNPQNAYSHYLPASKLLQELASRGHNVTMISPFKQEQHIPNYRDIQLTVNTQSKNIGLNEGKLNFFYLGEIPIWEHSLIAYKNVPLITEQALEHPAVQELLRDSSEHFDLIMFTLFYNEALFGLAHKYDAPVIIYNPIVSGILCNHLVGNVALSSYVPDLYTTFPGRMTFMERFYNTLFNLGQEIYRKYIYFPQVEATLHRHFPDAPAIFELMYNRTAMVFVNAHPVISNPVAHVPAMLDVGGLHLAAPGPLPSQLQQLLDGAPHGVILFSLGSNIRSADLSAATKRQLLSAFSRLKQTVIWKFEDDALPGRPGNVRIVKWCPQNDVLGHPNLKLFVTQGGLLSTAEAVFHAVPILGIPVFADQRMNMATIAQKRYGLTIPFKQLTEDLLFTTILEVISNPVYKHNVQLASKVLRSQPVRALDAAAFWVQHVLEHRGAPHLRTDAMGLAWYQLYSLDVICTCISIVLLFLLALFYIKYYVNKILVKILTYKKKTS